MTGESDIRQRRVTSKTADVGKFRRKFEGQASRHSSSDLDWTPQIGNRPEKAEPEPGYMAKLRAKAYRAGRTAKIWAIGNPTKDDPDKERLTYKVRRGVLTVKDKDGQTVMKSNEQGLNRYNGMTLRGEKNKEGEIELKGGWLARRKLKQANPQLTPREKDEIESAERKEKIMKKGEQTDKGKPTPRYFDNWFMDKLTKMRIKQQRRQLAQDKFEGRTH